MVLSKNPTANPSNCEICILAGGLSRRMGREKSRMRLGRRSMLGHIRDVARATGLPVRVIRRDSIPRCGPLGGIYTGLESTTARAVLFLSCDMPFITPELLKRLIQTRSEALFAWGRTTGVGFPFVLSKSCLATVEAQIHSGKLSVQALASRLGGRCLRLGPALQAWLMNVNTPEDWQIARGKWASMQRSKSRSKAGKLRFKP
jgi:molybdenum cofactor guanylyltransferase